MAKKVTKGAQDADLARVHSVAPLSEGAIDRSLAELSSWSRAGDSLQRTISFANFLQAHEFISKLVPAAEQAGHHPDILWRYNKVTITLSTHDAGNKISQKDFDLARVLDGFVLDGFTADRA